MVRSVPKELTITVDSPNGSTSVIGFIMLLTVPQPTSRPFGWPAGLAGFGIPYRWVCIDGPTGAGKSAAVEFVHSALLDYLSNVCEHLGTGSIGREGAEEVLRQVTHVRQPGAVVQLPDGTAVALGDVASSSMPAEASFGLFLADRVLQHCRVAALLKTNSLVIQQRGAFSTYVYQCVLGGISPSLFDQVTRALTPERPDLMILLSPGGDGRDAKAYSNPPAHILRLCAKNFALVSTAGLTPAQVAQSIVAAMSGSHLVLPLDR